ncbi:hypothetical protein TNIN_473021 [Trichonephila inaurata madagascariensis]|uniref:Uncharacterized protein n=1 Tax=Trichonephila inaurata madagascariensis TaxID=2747483 RepID=A0A8X6YHQ0_9ARAC|nr:hypothetical protein TNIN_473021 [Trichonephila inaurata madagascariensis]
MFTSRTGQSSVSGRGSWCAPKNELLVKVGEGGIDVFDSDGSFPFPLLGASRMQCSGFVIFGLWDLYGFHFYPGVFWWWNRAVDSLHPCFCKDGVFRPFVVFKYLFKPHDVELAGPNKWYPLFEQAVMLSGHSKGIPVFTGQNPPMMTASWSKTR